MKFGSVCSGIEAASVAWHPLGWRAAWLAEIEPFPSAVLAHHYPDVTNIGDMKKLLDLIPSGAVEAPDVFCGGTPCQAFSVAGLRKSLDDARGNLSLIFCEIANAIDTVRAGRGEPAAIIFWENVPGVLSTKDNAFGCFLAGLAGDDEALVPEPCPEAGKSSRYWKWNKKGSYHSLSWPVAGAVVGPTRTVAWRVLDAQYFGVAQRRRRVFVVASARTGFDPTEVLFEFDGLRRDTAPSRQKGEDVAACVTSGAANGGAAHGARSGSAKDNLIVPVAFGGNNTAGPIDVATACNACASASGRMDFESETFLVQPTPIDMRQASRGATKLHNTRSNQAGKFYENYTASLDANSPPPAIVFDTTQITSAANRSNPQPGDPCHPLAAQAHVPTICFSAGDYGNDAAFDLAPTMRKGGDGGGNQPAIAFSSKDHGGDATEDLSPTLRAMNHADSHANGGGQMAVAFQTSQSGVRIGETHATLDANNGPRRHNGALVGMQVRRLTPRECERLQSFQFRVTPDYPGAWEDGPGEWWSPDYTLIPGKVRKINPAKLDRDYVKYLARGGRMSFDECCQAAADGPRYKSLGNSWAVPNVRWIGRRIDSAIRATT